MSYSKEELNRIAELFQLIEGNKKHENSAPTYRDSPYLREIADIALRHTENDVETLEETIPALWYLTECYDAMCRAGMSIKYYTPQLEAHVKLMRLEAYDKDAADRFEDCFYSAVKARNYYVPDDCADLAAIVSGSMPEKKIRELICSAQENRRSLIKNDPVEKTEKYLAVIDEVEEKIDENKTMDFCLEYWNLKAAFLSNHGIRWRSPSQLNPGVMFD